MDSREPDPYKLYTVMRRSLKLHGGKIGAQCQHAYDYLTREVERLADIDAREAWRKLPEDESAQLEMDLTHLANFRTWRSTKDHAKIVLGATDEEYEQVKRENPKHFSVIDFGYTQVAPNTETCLVLWPMRESARSPILQKLRPL